jgi:hypothetical protein
MHDIVHFLHLIFDYLSLEQVVAVGVEIPWEQQFNPQNKPWEQTRTIGTRSRNMPHEARGTGRKGFKTQNKNQPSG